MTLSIRRSKQTSNFKNFKLVESPSLILAKKQNKLEDEVYKHKIFKLEKETSTTLIKLCKNIYETTIELDKINYELKRNKLETIYKNYNYCASQRKNKKTAEVLSSDLKSENNEINSKEEKLNQFLSDLTNKSENEVNYLLGYRPKTRINQLIKPLQECKNIRVKFACLKNKNVTQTPARPLTSTPYTDCKKENLRKRATSASKLRFEKSEEEESDDESDDTSSRSSSSKKSEASNDKTILQINDLYEKSIDNLNRIDSKHGFSNKLDDDDWLKDIMQIKVKQRESIKTNRGKFRVCTAWAAKLQTRHNIELTSRIRQNRITRRMENDKLYRYDMTKEKEIFELTHKNLKDLMLKQMYASAAKKTDRTVQEYIEKNEKAK
jgi:hypothetical protein